MSQWDVGRIQSSLDQQFQKLGAALKQWGTHSIRILSGKTAGDIYILDQSAPKKFAALYQNKEQFIKSQSTATPEQIVKLKNEIKKELNFRVKVSHDLLTKIEKGADVGALSDVRSHVLKEIHALESTLVLISPTITISNAIGAAKKLHPNSKDNEKQCDEILKMLKRLTPEMAAHFFIENPKMFTEFSSIIMEKFSDEYPDVVKKLSEEITKIHDSVRKLKGKKLHELSHTQESFDPKELYNDPIILGMAKLQAHKQSRQDVFQFMDVLIKGKEIGSKNDKGEITKYYKDLKDKFKDGIDLNIHPTRKGAAEKRIEYFLNTGDTSKDAVDKLNADLFYVFLEASGIGHGNVNMAEDKILLDLGIALKSKNKSEVDKVLKNGIENCGKELFKPILDNFSKKIDEKSNLAGFSQRLTTDVDLKNTFNQLQNPESYSLFKDAYQRCFPE